MTTTLPDKPGPEERSLSRDDTRAFYDKLGSGQDHQFYENRALEDLVGHSALDSARSVLEFGCGTGKLAARLLSERLPADARYAGLDLSDTMVRLATERLSRWSDRATVTRTDGAIRLPFEDQRFDRFVSTYVFDLLPTPEISEIVDEAWRVLKPDGLLCVASLAEGKSVPSRFVSRTWSALHRLSPKLVGGCRPIRLRDHLDEARWDVRHHAVITSFGITSDVIVAAKKTGGTEARGGGAAT